MTDYRNVLERDLARVGPAPFDFDDVARRRDRKRRNQRIAAGVVGIAAFVAAVWIVTSVGSLDRSETPVTPGETGPTVTGQTGTGEFYRDDFSGLPPEGTAPSTPAEGEVIADFVKVHVGFVYVYADGRVIWMKAATGSIYEQRLTPEAVDLVRSGAVQPRTFLEGWYELPNLPAGAWADPKIKQYVPPRYAICFLDEGNVVDPSAGVIGRRRLLPPEAEALLGGKQRTYDHVTAPFGGSIPPTTCFEVAIDQAHAVDDILSNATLGVGVDNRPAFQRSVSTSELMFAGEHELTFVSQRNDALGQLSIVFRSLLPQGEWIEWAG